uniref:Uncharacterized protein n=1 Tax=Arundo donax TaxID=35708 RepID=A0A0A9BF78_ARUDO
MASPCHPQRTSTPSAAA